MATVCREMDALHRLTNGIALLDVLQSFATVVSCSLHHSCESQLSLQLHHVIQAPERCSGALSCKPVWMIQHPASVKSIHQLNV